MLERWYVILHDRIEFDPTVCLRLLFIRGEIRLLCDLQQNAGPMHRYAAGFSEIISERYAILFAFNHDDDIICFGSYCPSGRI